MPRTTSRDPSLASSDSPVGVRRTDSPNVVAADAGPDSTLVANDEKTVPGTLMEDYKAW